MHMNKESSFYYQYILGDKDTFHLSWRVLKYPYHMMPHVPGILKKNSYSNNWGYGQIQRDFSGAPLFCHTTTYNWAQRMNYRRVFYFYTLPTREFDDFDMARDKLYNDFTALYPDFEAQCLFYLKQVRELITNKSIDENNPFK